MCWCFQTEFIFACADFWPLGTAGRRGSLHLHRKRSDTYLIWYFPIQTIIILGRRIPASDSKPWNKNWACRTGDSKYDDQYHSSVDYIEISALSQSNTHRKKILISTRWRRKRQLQFRLKSLTQIVLMSEFEKKCTVQRQLWCPPYLLNDTNLVDSSLNVLKKPSRFMFFNYSTIVEVSCFCER